MAARTTYPDPAWDAQAQDEKVTNAREQGHKADIPLDRKHPSSTLDVEKGVQSAATSTNSDERTLGGEPVAETEQDPNLVDWDGPDDPENPLNWPARKKWTLIGILAMVTLVTYVPHMLGWFRCSRS